MSIPIELVPKLAKRQVGINWLLLGWLATNETISTSTWEIDPTGATLSGEANNSGITSCYVEDTGTWKTGDEMIVRNRIVTSAGRKNSQTIILRVTP